MYGRSVYLTGFDKENFTDSQAAQMYFTSFHIAEEFSPDYPKRAEELLSTLKESGKKIVIDISPRGIAQLGYGSLKEFAEKNKECVIRCDFGFSEKEIFEAAKAAEIGINASTFEAEQVKRLKKAGAEIVALHNFYPRPETGLDAAFFQTRNAFLKEMGITTGAFLSGDGKRRGPLFEGLPTLEEHRNLPPYVQYAELTEKYGIDLVFTRDDGCSDEQEQLIYRMQKDGILYLPIRLLENDQGFYQRIWTVREDSPCKLARLLESREYATAGKRIEPKNCIERTAGSITIDNERYLRYSGEIQIMREDFPASEKVNVIGKLEKEYLPLLKLLTGKRKIQFVKSTVW